MTLRERLGLPTPPCQPTVATKPPVVPEWVRRASIGKLPVRTEVIR